MKFAALILTVSGALSLTGCSDLVSLNPFVTDNQAIQDPNLVGTWKSGDDDSLIVVQQNNSSYSVTYTDGKGMSLKLTARVFKAGDAELVDLVNENDAFLQVPVHAALRVWTQGSQLSWAFLDSKWLREQAGRELAAQASGEAQLLTSPGETVRSVLLKYAGDEKAYENKPTVFSRLQ